MFANPDCRFILRSSSIYQYSKGSPSQQRTIDITFRQTMVSSMSRSFMICLVFKTVDFLLLHRIKDTDCFLGIHDRKLYVLGLCRAISLGNVKPYVLSEVAGEILPSLLLIFEGLKRAYQSRAQEGEEEESDIEDGEDYEGLYFAF